MGFELAVGKEKEARERLEAVLAEVDLPEGVRLGEQMQQGMPDDAKSLLFAVGLSIVFIYLLMAFLFESFVLPLSIMLTIPLAFLGVAWGHLLTGLDREGVVVNNGIVLIDYVNRLRLAPRTSGKKRWWSPPLPPHHDDGPCHHFGMVPLLSAGSTSIGLSYTSFAVALVGGMTVATLLTLLVVPVSTRCSTTCGRTSAGRWPGARRGGSGAGRRAGG